MKWIELKDGSLVNLETITAIRYYAEECTVCFFPAESMRPKSLRRLSLPRLA